LFKFGSGRSSINQITMKLNSVLKYYLLTVLVSALLPFCVFRVSSNTFGNSVSPLKEIAIVTGIIAAANLPRLLLLIKVGFKARLAIVPFATVVPAVALYYFIYDPRSYMPVDLIRFLASIISASLNIFVLVYAYEKILTGQHEGVSGRA